MNPKWTHYRSEGDMGHWLSVLESNPADRAALQTDLCLGWQMGAALLRERYEQDPDVWPGMLASIDSAEGAVSFAGWSPEVDVESDLPVCTSLGLCESKVVPGGWFDVFEKDLAPLSADEDLKKTLCAKRVLLQAAVVESIGHLIVCPDRFAFEGRLYVMHDRNAESLHRIFWQ